MPTESRLAFQSTSLAARALILAGVLVFVLAAGPLAANAEQASPVGAPAADGDRFGPPLAYILRSLQREPNLPPNWLQLGKKLAELPGYERAGRVWLEAYLLARPTSSDSQQLRSAIEKLRAIPDPKAKTKLADMLEAMALDVRGSLYEEAGNYQQAIADFTREVELDPTQEFAREALERLTEGEKQGKLSRSFSVLGHRLSASIDRSAVATFDCTPSDYRDLTACTRSTTGGNIDQQTRMKDTIIFNQTTGAPAYVFSYRDKVSGHLEPGFQVELARVTRAIGTPRQHLQTNLAGDTYQSHIVIWGSIQLQQLSSDDIDRYQQRNLRKGYLVDYSLSVPYSARLHYPIFAVTGDDGIILNFRIDNDGTERMAIRLISPVGIVPRISPKE